MSRIGTKSTAISMLILLMGVNSLAHAEDLGCDWLRYRQEFNRPNATEAQKAELWEYERRTLKNTCNLTYDQYRASGVKKPVVVQRTPAGKPQVHKEVPVNDNPLPPSASSGTGKKRPNPSGTTSSNGVQ